MNLHQSQRTALVLAAGVLVGLAVGIPLGLGLDDDDAQVASSAPESQEETDDQPGDDGATTTTTAVPGEPREPLSLEGLEGPARELVELLRAGASQTFYGRWESDAMRGDEPQVEMEIWNSPPKVRRDNVLRSEASEVHTSEYDTGGDVIIRCARLDTDWRCAPSPYEEGTPVPGDLSLGAIGEDIGSRQVTVRDADVDGRAARCFTVAEDDGTFDLCVSAADGIPLLIDSPDAELRLVVLEREVDDAAFTPPGSTTTG